MKTEEEKSKDTISKKISHPKRWLKKKNWTMIIVKHLLI